MTIADSHASSRCAEILELLEYGKSWENQDAKLGAHLASYLTVIITGVVEDCVEHLVRQRVKKVNDAEVQQFVSESVRQRFRNPNHGVIVGLLNQFSLAYGDAFKAKISHNGPEASALQSVIDNKNNLAHSGGSNLTVTIRDVEIYYKLIIPIVEQIETALNI